MGKFSAFADSVTYSFVNGLRFEMHDDSSDAESMDNQGKPMLFKVKDV
jgi:hypothetical protein